MRGLSLLGLSLLLALPARARNTASPKPPPIERSGTVPVGPAPKTDAPAQAEDARALQAYGLPPRIYVQDPSGPQEAQTLIELYSLDTRTVTPLGGVMLAGLRRASPDQVRAITVKKLFMLTLAAFEYAQRKDDPRYLANPELLEVYRRRWDEVMAKTVAGDVQSAGLDPAAKPLGDALAGYDASLKLASEAMRAAPGGADTDKLAFIARVRDELTTLRLSPDGKPLLPSTLHALVTSIPEDKLTQSQWRALIESYPMGRSIWADRIDRLWRKQSDGHGVTVAVLDTGIDKDHPFLKGGVFDGGNFTSHKYIDHDHADAAGKDLFASPDNRGRHGTHVASTVLAYAPKARVLNVKVLDEEAQAEIAPELFHDPVSNNAAISAGLASVYKHNKEVAAGRKKDSRIDVVSLSLGMPGKDGVILDGQLDTISAWVRKLSREGVVVVVLSGNEGPETLRRPSQIPEAITVGAADYFGRPTAFSSEKPVPSIPDRKTFEKPDVWSYGKDVLAAKFDPKGGYENKGNGDLTADMDGTSMATPHVTAAVAILIQTARDMGVTLTTAQIQDLLKRGSDPLAVGNPYATSGGGLANPGKAVELLKKEYGPAARRPK